MAMTGQRQKSKEKSPTAQSSSSSLKEDVEQKDHGRKTSCKTKLCLMVLTVVVIVMGVSKMQQDSHATSATIHNSLRTAQKEQDDKEEVSAIASRSMTEDSSSTSTSSTQSTSTSTNTCQWRPEPLQGHCDGTKSTDESKLYTSAPACQAACCESPTCVTFQFRPKEGCLWGADTRVGNEKDGVTAWCEPRPPAVWQGQWIKTKQEGVEIDGGCSDDGWNPQELSGQCFGLGGKQGGANTARACRDACCNNPTCKLWQFRRDAGCFYNNHGFNCREAADPLEFEPFIGARKVQPTRSYTPYAYTADYADMAAEMEQKMQ